MGKSIAAGADLTAPQCLEPNPQPRGRRFGTVSVCILPVGHQPPDGHDFQDMNRRVHDAARADKAARAAAEATTLTGPAELVRVHAGDGENRVDHDAQLRLLVAQAKAARIVDTQREQDGETILELRELLDTGQAQLAELQPVAPELVAKVVAAVGAWAARHNLDDPCHPD